MIPYVRLQQASDRQLEAVLNDALDGAEAEIARAAGKTGVGAQARTSQMVALRQVAKKILKDVFDGTGEIVRQRQKDAAALAEDLLLRDEKGIWKIIEPSAEKRAKIGNDLRLTAARNIQATMKRVLETEQPLSSRVYKSQALAEGQVSKVVNRGIATGSSADDIARNVRDLIDPNVSGGVSYRAKTLARTEINNAFHAQSISDMKSRPWIDQAQWNLSKSHNEEGCVCETYAKTRLFLADRIPKKPHPGCLCSITPKLPDLDTALKSFMSGQYHPWLPEATMVYPTL